MFFEEAIELAEKGYFVTNEYFNEDEFLLEYNGKYYYEDGSEIDVDWLREQDFACGSWSVFATPEEIDRVKLEELIQTDREYGKFGVCVKKVE